MGDRRDGLLGTAVPEHPSETRLQRTVFDSNRPRGRLDERRAQPAVALSHLAGLVLPGTLMVTGTEGGPAGEVARAGKRAHIHADLRADDLRGALIDPGMLSSRVSASANGAITVSTCPLRLPMA